MFGPWSCLQAPGGSRHRRLQVCCLFEVGEKISFSYSLGDQVVNLREEIFTNRLRYSLVSLDDQGREVSLNKAVKALEK